MEATARIILALFFLCSILSPLASAWFFDSDYADLGPPDNPTMSAKPFPPPGKKPRNGNGHRLKGHKNVAIVEGFFKKFTNGGVRMKQEGGLRVGFYQESCPRAEQIVYDVISKAHEEQPAVTASIVQLHFHDCFVNGCDASILLDKTPSGERVEKQSLANKNLKGFDVMDKVKTQLEKECPGTVSCADIISFAARDALNMSGLPHFNMPGGRRDSLSSREAGANPQNIPVPTDTVDNMIATFVKKGLTIEDMVVLTGSHSIGVSPCFNFAYRVQKPNADKELDHRLYHDIRTTCPDQSSPTTLAFDPITHYKMDVEFYKTLLEKKGLLESDQKMADDPKTRGLVSDMASNEPGWLEKYARATVRMGNIGVLTGTQGEIRKQCQFVN